jgi:hypothetical protein
LSGIVQHVTTGSEDWSQTPKPNNQKKGKNMNPLTQFKKLPILPILLLLGCFSLPQAMKAQDGHHGPPIVGLWLVHYTSNFGPQFDTYQQWHSDGLEIESPSFSLGQCQGTWKQMANRTIQLFHVGWTVGNPPGTVRFVLTEVLTVSLDRNSFDGNYDQKFYDAAGNVVLEDMGTTHATRLSVN